MNQQRWKLRYTLPARKDLARIRHYTRVTYGSQQELIYKEYIYTALRKLADGPEVPGSKPHDAILPGMRTLHITLGGSRGRHFVVYRSTEPCLIEVLRILHDASDLEHHLSHGVDT